MKPLLSLLGSSLVAVFLVGCGDGGGGGAAEASKPATGAAPAAGGAGAMTVAVIPKGTIHEFWRSIEGGARKAEAELNAAGSKVQVIWKGPLREDDRDNQIQVIENFTARKVSGMVLAPLDSQALVTPVETAVGAGIPVVIIDSDLKTEKYTSFVATDNFRGGKKFPDIKIISSDQYAGATRETSYQASQNLLNRFGREVNGVFSPCEPVCVGMAKAIRDLGLGGGKVKMVGFDTGAQSIADLKAGDLQGLVVQNPFKMGYEGVITLVKSLKGEQVPKRLDTGVTLVTKDNMDQPEIKDLLSPPLDKYLK
jgi:ribose transport system substrate-binding protein